MVRKMIAAVTRWQFSQTDKVVLNTSGLPIVYPGPGAQWLIHDPELTPTWDIAKSVDPIDESHVLLVHRVTFSLPGFAEGGHTCPYGVGGIWYLVKFTRKTSDPKTAFGAIVSVPFVANGRNYDSVWWEKAFAEPLQIRQRDRLVVQYLPTWNPADTANLVLSKIVVEAEISIVEDSADVDVIPRTT